MHILLGILASVVTILFYLNRLSQSGIDFGWLNPFTWLRRKKWRTHISANPIFSMTSPMEVTACLMYAVAKSSGDISKDQKHLIIKLFKSEFHLNERDATELLSSCAYLLKHDEDEVINNLDKVLAPTKDKFTEDQKSSAFDLYCEVARCEDYITDKQKDFLAELEKRFAPVSAQKKWA